MSRSDVSDRSRLPPTKGGLAFSRSNTDMVSYEDLIIAQYLEELKKAKSEMRRKNVPISPYSQKMFHSDYNRQRHRPMSASVVGHLQSLGKPQIDAKFIADHNLWDAASPRFEKSGMNMKKLRPQSAPVKNPNRGSRPFSATSSLAYYSTGRQGRWFSRPSSGKRVRALYRKQPHTIRVTAYCNGTRDIFQRVAAPNMKMLLEYCTGKMGLPFAARRVFLEDGLEVFDARDISTDGEVYISMGENYKDPYETTKRNLILRNGAKWTLTGLALPEEGKKKLRKAKLSKRMRTLVGKKKVRIIVYKNGKSQEPYEVVADLSNIEEFLVACTAKLDLHSHARILYDWEGREMTCLAETPILDECLQPGGTPVLGPLWVSAGEGFSPSGIQGFLQNIIKVIKAKLNNAKNYQRQLNLALDDRLDEVTIATILYMSSDDLYEAVEMADSDVEELTDTLKRLQEKAATMSSLKNDEECEGSNYRMRHIQELAADNRLVGQKGIKLKVYENGLSENNSEFYFNLREAMKGVSNDKGLLLQRLLDNLSSSIVMGNPQNPKLASIAKKIFAQNGNEITDVMKLQNEQEIWVSFGEAFICPFTYCVQASFDQVKGYDLFGERTIAVREQLTGDVVEGNDHYDNWDASIGFPPTYDVKYISIIANQDEKEHVDKLTASEIDSRGSFLQSNVKRSVMLYPEVAVNIKLKRGHKNLWPPECQLWVISKNGYVYCKSMPQLCLCVSDTRVQCKLANDTVEVEGFVVTLQKKMIQDPHQMWQFNSDATISPTAYPDMFVTYNGSKTTDEEKNKISEIGKPGNKVYLMVCEKLSKKLSSMQRFALKQERFDNLGQWKFSDASNPEWSKLAYSWPVTIDGNLNKQYDWPMEGYLIPEVPPIRKDRKGSSNIPLRLKAMKNGEQDKRLSVSIVGSDLTNYLKELKKEKERKVKKSKTADKNTTMLSDAIEEDINLHCEDLTIRQLEFIMFLDQCTGMLDMPFAARRLFDDKGNEHFDLQELKRDQLVFVSCGEVWMDPRLTRAEQQRRTLLSQLSSDVGKIRQFCALRNPEKYVLEVEGSLAGNTRIIVNKQWNDDSEESEDQSTESELSSKKTNEGEEQEDDDGRNLTAHETAHQRSEQRLDHLKWPWERLVNVGNSLDSESESRKYTDKQMYEKFRPKATPRTSRDVLQHFEYEDGYIACSANRNLVLGVMEQEGRVTQVMLVKRRPDDINQLWLMKENGEIRSRHRQNSVLTVAMPANELYADDESRSLSFSGCAVTLQSRRTVLYGKAHQRWHYDAETGLIHAFFTDLPDKEITAANKADVCTFSIAGDTKIDQQGYYVEVHLPTSTEHGSTRVITVCSSCARSMRGRYRIQKLPDGTSFSCAMGNAKKLRLPQTGSFRVLNGKVDLSTHEADRTLQQWEGTLDGLREESSVRTIAKEINAAKTVRTVKVLAYKNGEGRLRPGEIVCGSTIEGVLDQCHHRLGLAKAARKMYTEDGTLVLETEDLIDWAIDNYKSLMVDQLERMLHGKDGRASPVPSGDADSDNNNGSRGKNMLANVRMLEQEPDDQGQSEESVVRERGDGEGQDIAQEIQSTENVYNETAEVDQQEAEKVARQRAYLLSQVRLPSVDVILRYPIEIWVSSGKPFVPPEVVESKVENRKKKRAFCAAVSLELDLEKHVLRQMKGRRLEEQRPGEYRSTSSSKQPVVIEGHWQEPSFNEKMKHDTVHKLKTHLAEVQANQTEPLGLCNANSTRRLYKQPVMKRILAYPNGENVERSVYVWGENIDQLLESATTKLNMWQRAKYIFNLQGILIQNFEDISKDEMVCISSGRIFLRPHSSRQGIEVKANWARARKQYGPSATDVTVNMPENPKVNVDPFGPPELALPSKISDNKTTTPSPKP